MRCFNTHSVEKLKYRGWQIEKPPLACTMEYNPVCGADDITYGNMCSLVSEHMAMRHMGECTDSKTQVMYVDSRLVDCVGIGPQKCMLIRDNPESEWEFFYDLIDGFVFEEGISYKLNVMVTEVENPPVDASSLRYTLLDILESFGNPDN